jgi:hypothetical protein
VVDDVMCECLGHAVSHIRQAELRQDSPATGANTA